MSLEVTLRLKRPDFTLDAAFTAPAAAVTALYGPSGAGKSTIAAAIAGLLPQAEGRVVLGDRVLLDSARRVKAPAHRRRVAVVFQEGRLFPHLSVAGNLGYGLRRAGASASADRLAEIAALLGLQGLLARRPATLSGGERQRVALGRALLACPELLVLDEPLASLDQARRAELLRYLERLREVERLAMVYVSHAVDEVARLADQVVALEAGRVLDAGPVADVFANLAMGPDAAARGAVAVLFAQAMGEDAAFGLTELAIGEARLAAPAMAAQPGTLVRLRIDPRDVILARRRPEALSASVVLAGRIRAIAEHGAMAHVRLDVAGQALVAHITRRSLAGLGLAAGEAVFAVVKSAAVAR